MKKIFYVLIFSVCSVLSAKAQVAEVTFDADDYASVGVYDAWENSPFRKGLLQGNAAVIDNPHTEVDDILGSAPNPTAKVLAVQRSRFGSNQFGARIDLKEPFSLKPQAQYVHVLVHRPVSGRVMLMGLGKHREPEWASQSPEVEQFWSISMTNVKPDQWTDAVFQVKGVSGVDIYSLVLVPECESPHNRTEDFIAYIDQIVVNNSSTPLVSYDEYPTNFDKESTKATRDDRGILSVALQGVKTLSITSSPSTSDPVYRDRMDATFPVKPGQSVKPVFGYKSDWMCGYLYIDYGQDGKFSYTINDDFTPAEGSDLVSYSAYEKHNSLGKELANNNTLTMPNFTVPASTPLGFYRMRFKVDWNSLDPGGNMADGNTIMGNGGGIVDVRLNVHADEVSVMEDNRNGEILNADGTSLVTTTPFGQAFTIKLNPATGFAYNGVRIRHGYNLTGDSLVHETPQYVDEVVYRNQFDENDCYTIKAEWVDGDMMLEGLFVEKGTEMTFDYPINFDKEKTENPRDNPSDAGNHRRLNRVTMNGTTYTMPADKLLYHEDMSQTFFAKSGEQMTTQFNYSGSWMHGYVYIDKGQDGMFDVGDVSNGVIGSNSDVMTFSFWSGDNTNGQSGYNSNGANLTAAARNVLNPPVFTMPQLADGFYRIRFKVDWNEIDPAGNITDDNKITKNGGGFADARLRIFSGSTVNLTVESAENGSVTAADGSALPSTVPFHTALTIALKPSGNATFESLSVTHGELAGNEKINSVPQRLTEVYTSNDISGETFTLPEEIIDGDVVLKAVFKGDASGIESVENGSANVAEGLYDLQGRKLRDNVALPKGIYIENNRKIAKY
ncbi:MAG: glycoside hydrolase family 16 protein [Prevotella sp.]|nr:glycoside hydrolase family 16 protein [Prevotella sp.]